VNRVTAIALMLAAALSAPAHGQAFQCRPPRTIPMPPPVKPDGPRIAAPLTGYTLAISWSPEFCRGADRLANPLQCSGQIGRFGFVLHGLWPEAAGSAPQWCAPNLRPTAADLQANLCMTPVPWLLEHEWAKHGSCMAATPRAYFAAEQALWRGLNLPDADRLSRRDGLTAGELRQAFATRNPQIPRRAIGILIGHDGWLREVRLCYSLRRQPSACPARTYGPADQVPLKIWRGL
jgi:ribonuclease T2